jgi:beta-catenin-like protein 1
MPDNPTPEMLKKMKADIPPTPPAAAAQDAVPSKGKARAVTVEDAEDEGDTTPSLDFAPGGDADYFMEEDDEGRFFGGGLTSEQKDILNIFDSAGGEGAQEDVSRFPWNTSGLTVVLNTEYHPQLETLSLTGIRRTLLRFERAMNKNQDQRSKWPNDPTK